MNHWKFAKTVVCALLTAAGTLSCSSQNEPEALAETSSALVGTDQFLYFTCNATGWNVGEANRLRATSDPAVFTLDYQVLQPWLVSSPDQCGFVLTNQFNGWGSSQIRYSDSHPSTAVVVPGADRHVQRAQ